MHLRKMLLFVVALTALLVLSGTLAGCSSSQPSTAHYRGDSVYGDDGKQKKHKKKKKKGTKGDGGSGGNARPQRPRVDPGLLARARGIANPMERALVEEAAGWIGTPYLYGGTTRAGADCSGLVMEVYREVCGVKLPRSSAAQSRWCAPVAPDKMQPGDLVFFAADSAQVSHVGMFIGDGRMIHASSSRGVMVSALDNPYWLARFHSIGRVASAETAWRKQKGASGLSQEPLVATHSKSKNNRNQESDQDKDEDTADGNTIDATIFNLDLAITQKADSIFNTQLQQ